MQSTEAHNPLMRPYQRRWIEDDSRLALVVKGAQLGYSTATAAMAVLDCLGKPGALWVLLSRSDRQSLELSEKCKFWVKGISGGGVSAVDGSWSGTSITQHVIKFGNGSRIIALPANPETARGYTGNAVLDEFAFHADAEKIFRAVYRQTTLGYKVRVVSTPNGQRGKFYELARQLGLEGGTRPAAQPVRRGAWSGHWCDIGLAVEEGAELDVEAIRSGCDAETFEQEYQCSFISQLTEWLSAESVEAVMSAEASTHLGAVEPQSLVGGWDVARKQDKSILWLSEMVGDVTWTRGVVELTNLKLPQQLARARSLMPYIRRLHIDPSSIGMQIAEEMEQAFPGRVQRVTFTVANKERLAVLAKRRIEEQKVRVPDTAVVRHSFRSIGRKVNAIGQASFDAERDSKGHGDHFWAFALAESAAEYGGRELGMLAYEKTERARTLAKPVFGAASPKCPCCGSRVVARVGAQQRCGQCGLQWGDAPVQRPVSRTWAGAA